MFYLDNMWEDSILLERDNLNFKLLACMCAKSLQSCSTLCNTMKRLWPARFLWPWNTPDKNTVVGCHFLLQGIFLTQGLNPRFLCLLRWQVGSWLLAPPELPKQWLLLLKYSRSFLCLYTLRKAANNTYWWGIKIHLLH